MHITNYCASTQPCSLVRLPPSRECPDVPVRLARHVDLHGRPREALWSAGARDGDLGLHKGRDRPLRHDMVHARTQHPARPINFTHTMTRVFACTRALKKRHQSLESQYRYFQLLMRGVTPTQMGVRLSPPRCDVIGCTPDCKRPNVRRTARLQESGRRGSTPRNGTHVTAYWESTPARLENEHVSNV